MLSGFFSKIEETIARDKIYQSWGNELKWVLTGGDHKKVGACLRPTFLVNPQLVLDGALIVSKNST